MAHISIPLEDMPIEILEITPVNPLISKCQIKVCYVGQEANRNRSIITKDVARDLAASIPGCPIVGLYNEEKGDFEEHNRIIEIANGKFKIKDATRPYGFVSMDAKVWFQWFEDDGTPHEYLCTEGYIWTGQYPESQRVIDKGNNQSMELDEDSLNAFWTKDNNGKPQFFIINEAIMSKLCILGEDVEPCFEGAAITPVQFSFEDDYKNKLFSFMEKMQEILSNEGGTPVFNTYAVEIGDNLWSAIYGWLWEHRYDDLGIHGIYEDNGQKFVILRSRKDLTYFRLNFSLTDEDGFVVDGDIEQVAIDFVPVDSVFAADVVEAFETQFKAAQEEKPADPEPAPEAVEEPAPEEDPAPAVEEPVEDPAPIVEEEPVEAPAEEPAEEPVVESHEDEEKPVAYNLEDVVEYQELLGKYADLEGQIAQLRTTLEERENTINSLTAENKTLTEFKQTIDRENKQKLINSFYMLSDDQKKDCIDNIDKYSMDEIEAKLSVICVRNKVSFDLDKKPEEAPVTYNLDSIKDDDAGLPAWVLRVKEVEKQKNL